MNNHSKAITNLEFCLKTLKENYPMENNNKNLNKNLAYFLAHIDESDFEYFLCNVKANMQVGDNHVKSDIAIYMLLSNLNLHLEEIKKEHIPEGDEVCLSSKYFD